MGLFEREAHFYATVAAEVPVRTPHGWYIGDGDTTPLLLEDLGDLRMGDQMDGMTLADAEATVTALADLHAAFWESDRLAEPWLASPAEGVFAAMIGQLVASGAPTLAERYGDQVPAEVMAAIIDRAPAWTELLTRLAEGPQTLVHNDARLDNLFFGPDGAPCLIDWQLVARTRGTQDIGNLLAGSMEGDELSAHWEHLLRRYHDRLVEGGVSGYSYDQCLEHYRQSILFPLGAGMALLGAMDIGDGRGLGDRIVTRCLRHITELESFKAL
jgi:aminoglycoside phosphotransferase (APT) family kinase protein